MSPNETLAEWRKGQSISQAELAKRLGIWPSTINRIEAGKARPGIRLASRLAKLSDGAVSVASWCEVDSEEVDSDIDPEERVAS